VTALCLKQNAGFSSVEEIHHPTTTQQPDNIWRAVNSTSCAAREKPLSTVHCSLFTSKRSFELNGGAA
jgi:hypothetical protein